MSWLERIRDIDRVKAQQEQQQLEKSRKEEEKRQKEWEKMYRRDRALLKSFHAKTHLENIREEIFQGYGQVEEDFDQYSSSYQTANIRWIYHFPGVQTLGHKLSGDSETGEPPGWIFTSEPHIGKIPTYITIELSGSLIITDYTPICRKFWAFSIDSSHSDARIWNSAPNIHWEAHKNLNESWLIEILTIIVRGRIENHRLPKDLESAGQKMIQGLHS